LKVGCFSTGGFFEAGAKISMQMTYLQQNTPITLEWIRSLSTLAACLVALAVALFSDTLKHLFYKPELRLEALVRRPDAEKVGRFMSVNNQLTAAVGDAWFFRLEVTNHADTPARDVQVYLKKVERADGTVVDKFTSMNLKWANTGVTTRKVLLKELPVFCDFIHVSEPAWKTQTGEDLDGVPSGKGVMCLDVEATNTGKGHLLGPGAYRFHLYVAAENFPASLSIVEVRYDGTWHAHRDQMFDQEIGFRMKKV
jgi:hypothetical protein